jgi:hypothetical protein
MLRKTKHLLYSIGIASLALLTAAGIYVSFFQPKEVEVGVSLNKMYSSVEEMQQEADLIVEGKALSGQKNFFYDRVPFTLTSFQIDQVYEGNAPQQVISILETGGVQKNMNFTVEGNEVMDADESYVLLLKKYEGPVTNEPSYVIVGAYQGKFALDGNRVSVAEHVNAALQQIETKDQLLKQLDPS